jgi:hypothetical protein
VAAVERVLVASPIASAPGRVIASPFQFWTTGEEYLRIISWNSAPGVTIAIYARQIDTSGNVNVCRWMHTPNTDRSLASDDFPLGVGSLLNLTACAASGTPEVGQTFLAVRIVRGQGPGSTPCGTMIQGYVTLRNHLAWPGSPVEDSLDKSYYYYWVPVADPGSGHEIDVQVPTGARWQLIVFATALRRDIGSSSSNVYLMHCDTGGGMLHRTAFDNTTSMGLVNLLEISPMYDLTVSHALGEFRGAWCGEVRLLQGEHLKTATANISSFDRYYNVAVQVREWLEIY